METKLKNGGCVHLYKTYWNKTEICSIQVKKNELTITEGIQKGILKYHTRPFKNQNDTIVSAMCLIRSKRVNNFKFKKEHESRLKIIPEELQQIIWKILFNSVLQSLLSSQKFSLCKKRQGSHYNMNH